MSYSSLCQTNYSIYPGEFVPLMNEEEVKAQFPLNCEREYPQPAVNLKETEDTYKIEFALPGFKREELLILADDNILTIYGIHKEKQNNISEKLKFNEFKYDYFEKRITLPENLDIEFVAANYESGVIRIYIPKTARPVKNVHQIIVVY